MAANPTLGPVEAAVEVLKTAIGLVGGGDATAVNQATQITAEQAILAKLVANPALETGGNLAFSTAFLSTIDTSTSAAGDFLASIDSKTPILGQAAKTGSVPVTLASDQGALTVAPSGGSFNHISTATTTQVKSGAGVFQSLQINTVGAGTTTISIYDATSGTSNPIAVISGLTLGNFQFNCAFTTGLRVITTGSITAPDITVIYQ